MIHYILHKTMFRRGQVMVFVRHDSMLTARRSLISFLYGTSTCGRSVLLACSQVGIFIIVMIVHDTVDK